MAEGCCAGEPALCACLRLLQVAGGNVGAARPFGDWAGDNWGAKRRAAMLGTGKVGGFNLSLEQQQAVEHVAGHLQLLACAGSGKTETMAWRVCRLLERGVEPAQIVAFTFTERAAESLRARIEQRVAEALGGTWVDRLTPLYVGTIHGYCWRLLQTHLARYGNYEVLDEHRLVGLVSHRFRELGLDTFDTGHWQTIHTFLRNVDALENELIDLRDLARSPFGDVVRRYYEMLRRRRYLSFGLIIATAVQVLESDAGVYRSVHGGLRHLLVDEYQDINPAQERLIELLARPPVELCVVGDDDQAIYQWRGSDVSNILRFAKRYGARVLGLSMNRRSRPQIIAAANAFAVRSISPRIDKQMRPQRPGAGPEICCWQAETPDEEAAALVQTMRKLHERGYRWRDMAVLYRSVRTSARPLVQALTQQKIPFRCAGRTGLFQQPEAAVLGKFYAWLTGSDWRAEPYAEPQPVEEEPLLQELREVFRPARPLEELQQFMRGWRSRVAREEEAVDLVREYYRLLHVLDVHKWDLEEPLNVLRLGTLARLSQILADYEHVARRGQRIERRSKEGPNEGAYRGGRNRGVWYYRGLFNYMQYYARDAYEDFVGEESLDLDQVQVLTVHQAKGLEWPVVFVPSLTNRRFPSSLTGKAQRWYLPETLFPAATRARYEGSLVDERRLFYVAMTRARDMLYLSCFARLKRAIRPSPFFVEVCGGRWVGAREIALPPHFQPPSGDPRPLPMVSVTDLVRYHECPRQYRLREVLGFQPQIALELGYGRSIHQILCRLAEITRQQGALPSADQVDAMFENEFYLPFANAAMYHELAAYARRLIGRYLTQYGQDLLRIWAMERPLALRLPEGTVTGRADLIVDDAQTPPALALVEYKSAGTNRSDQLFALQLVVYAAAARAEGLHVKAAYLHRLKEGKRAEVAIDGESRALAVRWARRTLAELSARRYPPKPHTRTCSECDVHLICADSLRKI